jgi:hypothetical protein
VAGAPLALRAHHGHLRPPRLWPERVIALGAVGPRHVAAPMPWRLSRDPLGMDCHGVARMPHRRPHGPTPPAAPRPAPPVTKSGNQTAPSRTPRHKPAGRAYPRKPLPPRAVSTSPAPAPSRPQAPAPHASTTLTPAQASAQATATRAAKPACAPTISRQPRAGLIPPGFVLESSRTSTTRRILRPRLTAPGSRH